MSVQEATENAAAKAKLAGGREVEAEIEAEIEEIVTPGAAADERDHRDDSSDGELDVTIEEVNNPGQLSPHLTSLAHT